MSHRDIKSVQIIFKSVSNDCPEAREARTAVKEILDDFFKATGTEKEEQFTSFTLEYENVVIPKSIATNENDHLRRTPIDSFRIDDYISARLANKGLNVIAIEQYHPIDILTDAAKTFKQRQIIIAPFFS